MNLPSALRLSSLILAVGLALLVVGCGDDDGSPSEQPAETPTQITGVAELSFGVEADGDTRTDEDTVDVGVGQQFSLSVDVLSMPAQGSVGVQAVAKHDPGLTFVSGAGAAGHPCSNVFGPDTSTPGTVVIACVTDLSSPEPFHETGTIFELSFRCSDQAGSNRLSLPVGQAPETFVEDDDPPLPRYGLVTVTEDGEMAADAITINCTAD